MKNFIKRLVLFIIIVILLIAFCYVGHLAYTDIKASKAKDYLIERYGFDKKEITATKSTEYVYEDIANCESLWFKKCSPDKNLHYEHTFKLKDGTEIHVSETNDRKFNDDYTGKVINYNRDDEKTNETNETTNQPNEKENS